MNRMTAVTVSPGTVTAAARLMPPSRAPTTTAPAPASTSKNVPSVSENSLRHSSEASSKSSMSGLSSASSARHVAAGLAGAAPPSACARASAPRLPGSLSSPEAMSRSSARLYCGATVSATSRSRGFASGGSCMSGRVSPSGRVALPGGHKQLTPGTPAEIGCPDDRHALGIDTGGARRAQPPGAFGVETLGPVPERACVGDGARGLQRRRRRLGVLPARPRALARVPLERGRARRDLRRPPAAVLRVRAVERARPDPQGAHLRAHRARGQPRRGRQGVLVVPRLHADALVDALALRVPAGGVPVRRAVAENARRGRRDPEYELLDTGVFDGARYWDVTVDYAKAAPDDICMRVAGPQRGARPGEPRRPADAVVPQPWSWEQDGAKPSIRDERRGARGAGPGARHDGRSTGTAPREPLFCENETNAQRLWGARGTAVSPRTGSATTSSRRRRPSTRPRPAPRPRFTTASTSPPARPSRSGCGWRPSAATWTRSWSTAMREPRARGGRVLRRARAAARRPRRRS